MPEALKRFGQQIAEYWKNLDKSQKRRIYITSAILAVSIILGLIWITRPNNVVLVSGADPKEVKEMQAILSERGIKNSVMGGNLIVDMKDSDRARFELAASGYPKHGMTFADALELISFNSTESDKKQVWKERDRQSIIAQLKMFDFIEDAEIQIVVPEKSYFDNVEKKPTAAVTVKTRDGTLTPSQVEGIKAVVSKSIEGLDPEDITVVDTTGRMFDSEYADSTMAALNTQESLRLKRKYELTNAVYELFNVQSDAYDMVKVVVNPVLDFDRQVSQSREISSPEGAEPGLGLVESSEVIKESVVNTAAAGVPGIETNPGDEPPVYQIGDNQNGNYQKNHSVYSYLYNQTETEHEKAVGNIIPEKTTATITLMYGNRVKDDSRLTPEYIEAFRQAAGNAIGVPPQNVSVVSLKLAPAEVAEPTLNDRLKEIVNDYGFFAVMMVLILVLMISAIPRRKQEEVAELAAAAAEEQAAVAVPRFVAPEPTEPLPEIDLEEKSEVKKQIDKFVTQKPEAVAQLLRNWLSEDWE